MSKEEDYYCDYCGVCVGTENEVYYWESGNDIYELCRDCFEAFVIEVEKYTEPVNMNLREERLKIEQIITERIKQKKQKADEMPC